MRLVCVVLNCRPMFEESAELLRTCANEFKLYDLTQLYDYERTVEVVDGRKGETRIGTKEKFVYPLTKNELENLKIVYDYPKCVQAPLSKDSEIGKIEIFLGNNLLFSEKIYTIEDVKTKSILQRMQDFFKNW